MEIPNLSEADVRVRLSSTGISDNPLVLAAFRQAKRSHASQRRDDGTSYLEQHIYPVVASVIECLQFGKEEITPEILAAAFLHDVLEDDRDMTEDRFRSAFGEEVFSYVKTLTKPENAWTLYPGKDKQDKKLAYARDYMKILEAAPREAIIIKLADRLNNLSCLHASGNEAKYARYIIESEELYLPFAKKASPFFYSRLKEVLDAQKKKRQNK